MSQPWGCSLALWEAPGCLQLLPMEHYGQSLSFLPSGHVFPQNTVHKKSGASNSLDISTRPGAGRWSKHLAPSPKCPQMLAMSWIAEEIWAWARPVSLPSGCLWGAILCCRDVLQGSLENAWDKHKVPGCSCGEQSCCFPSVFWDAPQLYRFHLGFPLPVPTEVLYPELVGQSFGGLWSSWLSLVSLGAEAGEYRGDDGFCPAGIGWCPTKHSHSRNSSYSLQLYFAFFFFLKSSQDKFSLCCASGVVDVPGLQWSDWCKKMKET